MSTPSSTPDPPPKPRRLTAVEQTQYAEQVIKFYLPLRGQSNAKRDTARHFKKTLGKDRSVTQRIIQKYEERGTWEHKKRPGRPTKLGTDEALRQKFAELCRDNPSLNSSELAQLLGISRSTVMRYWKRLRQELEDKSNSNSSSQTQHPPSRTERKPTPPIEDSNPGNVEKTPSFKCEDEDQTEDFEDVIRPQDFLEQSFQDYPENDLHPDVKPELLDLDLGDLASRTAQGVIASKSKARGTNPAPSSTESVLQTCFICRQIFSKPLEVDRDVDADVIFLLQKVLKLESERLKDLIKPPEGQAPRLWLCDTCQRFKEEASSIRKQLLKLELRMKKCRRKILKEMGESHGTTQGETVGGKRRHCGSQKSRSSLAPKRLRRRVLRMTEDEQELELANAKISLNKVEVSEEPKQCDQLTGEGLPMTEAGLRQIPTSPTFQSGKLEPEIVGDFDFNSDDLYVPSYPSKEDFSTTASRLGDVPSMPGTRNMLESTPVTNTNPSSAKKRKIAVSRKARQKSKSTPATSTTSVGLSLDIQLPAPHTIPSSICEICGSSIKYMSLSTHKLQAHGVVMEGFTAINCDAQGCTFRALSKDKMQRHKMKEHGAERPYVCMFCAKRFVRRNQLTEHEDIHRNKETRPYVCDLCPSRFAVKTYLYIHKRQAHRKPHRKSGEMGAGGGVDDGQVLELFGAEMKS